MLFSIETHRRENFRDLPVLADLERMMFNGLPDSSRKELDFLIGCGKSISAAFSSALIDLSKSPSSAIRELISYYDRLIRAGNHTRIVASTHMIQLVGADNISWQTAAIIPTNWHVMYDRNPIFEKADIVTLASRARDAYNRKLEVDKNSRSWQRGEAYEAEFLMSALAENPHVFLTTSQKNLIEKWPRGIHAGDGLEYLHKAVE
jgi:hypothetical protein